MGKNCLEEYLTDCCKDCEFWRDGSDKEGKNKESKEKSFGCAYPGPIMNCQAFAQMYNEEEKRRKENEEI